MPVRAAYVRLILAAGLLFALTALTARADMPRVELTAGIHRIQAEVAHTEAQRQQGLMHRTYMAINQGMLFVFPQPQRVCMWMRNTFLPLSVAFLDAQGKIINIADMQPRSDTTHCADAPARYALEMNQGWFAAKGIAAGAAIQGLDRAPPAR